MHPVYNVSKKRYKNFQNSINYYKSAISLPIYEGLETNQQKN